MSGSMCGISRLYVVERLWGSDIVGSYGVWWVWWMKLFCNDNKGTVFLFNATLTQTCLLKKVVYELKTLMTVPCLMHRNE